MAGGALLRFLLPRASMNYIFYLRRAAAKITKSAAPFIFTAATAGTGNSRILSDEILGSSRRMTQGRNSSFRNSLYGIPKFAVAAVKTRLQDFLLRTRWVSDF